MYKKIIVEPDIVINREIELTGENSKIIKARKNRPGEIITISDPNGDDYRGRITKINSESTKVFVFEKLPYPTESNIEITLLQALPEKERMELIIQKATELGVTRIVPFKSAKSISLKEREEKQKKAHHWPDVALKASMQCRRAIIPRVENYSSFKKALTYSKGDDLKIILWEKEKKNKLRDIIEKGKVYRKICILIGPEGGFVQREVYLAKVNGFLPIKLGPRILRTETAAIVSVTLIQHLLGDLN